MNRIYLFGKIIYISKLKYIVKPKLKVYIEMVVETDSRDKFNCVVYEKNLEKLHGLYSLTCIYIVGSAILKNQLLKVIVNEIYALY